MKQRAFAAIALASVVTTALGQSFDSRQLNGLEYRALGPYRVGAWVSDFAIPENGRDRLYTWYVAMRSGGVWKTTNNGTTFAPVFDGNGVQAIGDVTVAPSDNNVVWVGTGDNANARSSHAGIGAFKSLDGGDSWTHMGLDDSHHIARIAIHPDDADVVYVAAIGHLFSKNEQRGLFRSRDGGDSWDKVLYIDDGVSVVDVAIDRSRPNTIFAATYEMERLPWHFEAGGPASAIYRSKDGGDTWERLGNGLPDGNIGRIGIDIHRANTDVVYTVFENLNLRDATPEEAAADREEGKPVERRRYGGEVYRSDDGGDTWRKTHADKVSVGDKAPYSFNQIFVDPNDEQNVFVTSVYLANSTDGGKSWHDLDNDDMRLFANNFGDVRTFWIDPQDSQRMLFGSDGGVYISYDGGKSSDFLYNIPGGEFYAVGVDLEDPYNIYSGMQDHESWKGPINSWSGAVMLEDWVLVGLWDGMYNQVDQSDNRYLYTTAQFGGHLRVDQVNGTRSSIQPPSEGAEPKPRFPWTPAIQISPHDRDVVFVGSQRLLRSPDRGDSWEPISPDLTHATRTEDGGRCVDAGGAQGWINYCTITTLDQSVVDEGVIWAGTDDGRVHVTENGGDSWREVTAPLATAGAPNDFWVSRVRASRYAAGSAYVTKNGMRFDRFSPQVYRTTDFGRSWQPIHTNLPQSPVNVIVEDARNSNLLFVGTDQGVWFSLDAGDKWHSLKLNMPVVPVKDLVVHPRENDLVAATYGRGIYVVDVSVIQQMTPEALRADAWLFQTESNVVSRSQRQDWGSYHLRGDRHLATPNEPAGFNISYWLNAQADNVAIEISDSDGEIVGTLEGPTQNGLNQVHWDSATVDGVEAGTFSIAVTIENEQFEHAAVLRPPRAFAIGPSSGPLQPDR